MRRGRDDLELPFAIQPCRCLLVELDNFRIALADDQQRRRLHVVQMRPGKIRTAAARHHGRHVLGAAGRGDERRRRPRAGAETARPQIGRGGVRLQGVDRGDEAFAEEGNVEAKLGRAHVDRFLVRSQEVHEEGRESAGLQVPRNGLVAPAVPAAAAAVGEDDDATCILGDDQVAVYLCAGRADSNRPGVHVGWLPRACGGRTRGRLRGLEGGIWALSAEDASSVTQVLDRCPHCHEPVDAARGSKFCAACGTSLVPATAPSAACEACGQVLPDGANFCDACGHAVGAAPTVAVTAPLAPPLASVTTQAPTLWVPPSADVGPHKEGLAAIVRTGEWPARIAVVFLLLPFWLTSEIRQASWPRAGKVAAIASLWLLTVTTAVASTATQPVPPPEPTEEGEPATPVASDSALAARQFDAAPSGWPTPSARAIEAYVVSVTDGDTIVLSGID